MIETLYNATLGGFSLKLMTTFVTIFIYFVRYSYLQIRRKEVSFDRNKLKFRQFADITLSMISSTSISVYV